MCNMKVTRFYIVDYENEEVYESDFDFVVADIENLDALGDEL
jgi:hypothetical protein